MVSKETFAEILDNMAEVDETLDELGFLGVDIDDVVEPLINSVTLALGEDLTEVLFEELRVLAEYDDEDCDCCCCECCCCDDEDDEDWDDYDDEDEFYLVLKDPMDTSGDVVEVETWMDAYDYISKGFVVC